MPVYVDNAAIKYGRMLMYHMWADTDDELLAMADKILVDRKWIQGHPTLSQPRYRGASWVHFDVAHGKRWEAVRWGAIQTDRYGPVEHTAKLDLMSDSPKRQERGANFLAMVLDIRMRALRRAGL